MSWRWVPPAHSPVSPLSLARGAANVAGVLTTPEEAISSALERRYGTARVTLTDSGTSALTLALQAVAAPGASVAFPGYSCVDLITAAQGAGIHVRLYDIDPHTLSPDLESLSLAVSRGAEAILVAPLYGYPFDVDGVNEIAARAGIPVVEDAAQSAGGKFRGQRIGAFGAITVLSFARGKGTTGGSGGALLVRDNKYLARCAEATAKIEAGDSGLGDVVKLGAQWVLGRPSLYGIPSSVPALRLGEMIYHPPRPARAMSRAARSMLAAALALDDGEIAARRWRAAEISALVKASRHVALVESVGHGTSGFLRLAVRDITGRASPAPRAGVLRGYPITLDEHEMSRTVLAHGERAGAGAAELRDRLFTLPVHSRMTATDVRHVGRWLERNAGSA